MEGVTIHHPRRGVIHLEFPTAYLVASTFLRFQEHYESPVFAGKIFTLEEFMDWYASEHNGVFSYYADWMGFNVPSRVFVPFREGAFDPLTKKETWLLDRVRDMQEPFYAIGTVRGESPSYVTHELAHARYALEQTYREAVHSILTTIPASTRGLCDRILREQGYAEHVLEDELHAYLLSDPEGFKSVSKHLPRVRAALTQAFKSDTIA